MFSVVLISVGAVLMLAMVIPNVFAQADPPLIQRLIRASPELVEPCGDDLSDCLVVLYESPTRVVMYGEYFTFTLGFKEDHNQAIWKAVDLLESEGFTMKDMELDNKYVIVMSK
jgi:hypothetical protein